MDQQQMQRMNQAAEQLTDASQQSFRVLVERTVELGESNLKITQNFFQSLSEHLKDQAQANQNLAQGLNEQARTQSEAFQALTQESVNAYEDLLFNFAYQKAVGTATQVALNALQSSTQTMQQSMRAASLLLGMPTTLLMLESISEDNGAQMENGHSHNGSSIALEERKGFSKRYPEAQTSLYEIQGFGENLGFVYINSSSRTLVWRGTIDFALLEKELLRGLPLNVSNVDDLSILLKYNYSVKVSLILSSDELIELDFDQPAHREQYRNIMEDPNQVAFVRYDLYDNSRPGFRYSFTAENSRLWDANYGELALQLPSKQDWLPNVIKWVFQHHEAAEVLEERADPVALGNNISKIELL
jgi:hypothetical protein